MANSSAVCLAVMQAAYDIMNDDYELTLVPVGLLLCLNSRDKTNDNAYDQYDKLGVSTPYIFSTACHMTIVFFFNKTIKVLK